MKKILLPTDFSENSWSAINYALNFFENEECTFYILNTYTPAIVHNRFLAKGALNQNEKRDTRTISERGLKKILYKIYDKVKNPRHEFKTISSFSLLVDEVKDIVYSESIDLIIMGAKGNTDSNDICMGAKAVRILKAIKSCPILTIPNDFDYKLPAEIIFATDLKRFYNIFDLEPIIELAKLYKAKIRILHIQQLSELSELQQFNLNVLNRHFKDVAHEIHLINAKSNSISETIQEFAKDYNILLLAMLNYQHSFIEKVTRESMVKRSVFNICIPFLIIPELSIHSHYQQATAAQVAAK